MAYGLRCECRASGQAGYGPCSVTLPLCSWRNSTDRARSDCLWIRERGRMAASHNNNNNNKHTPASQLGVAEAGASYSQELHHWPHTPRHGHHW
jgi:hypothetical protein